MFIVPLYSAGPALVQVTGDSVSCGDIPWFCHTFISRHTVIATAVTGYDSGAPWGRHENPCKLYNTGNAERGTLQPAHGTSSMNA